MRFYWLVPRFNDSRVKWPDDFVYTRSYHITRANKSSCKNCAKLQRGSKITRCMWYALVNEEGCRTYIVFLFGN